MLHVKQRFLRLSPQFMCEWGWSVRAKLIFKSKHSTFFSKYFTCMVLLKGGLVYIYLSTSCLNTDSLLGYALYTTEK